MGIDLGVHHLSTFIQMNLIVDHVLTDEWQSTKEMYPIFVRELTARSKIKPVLRHNFSIQLKKLCKEGKAECMLRETPPGKFELNRSKLYRRTNGDGD